MPSRTSNERHYGRTSKVDPSVIKLAEKAPMAELGEEVAPEQAPGRARGVMRAEIRLALVLAPLPFGSRVHEGDAAVLGVAKLERGERDRRTVRVTGDNGSGLVKYTPTLDKHQVRATRVDWQKVTRHCVVLALRQARDGDSIVTGEVCSSCGVDDLSAKIHEQSVAAALLSARIASAMS
jgi:hypothetical protein